MKQFILDRTQVKEGKLAEAVYVEQLVNQDAYALHAIGFTQKKAIEKALKMNVILLTRVLK